MRSLRRIESMMIGCVCAAGVLAVSGGVAPAAVLNPGQSTNSLTGTYSVAGDNYITSQTTTHNGMVTNRNGTFTFDFSLTTTVYYDNSTGGDDFVYQLTNTGPVSVNTDSFDALALSSFGNRYTDVDYEADGGAYPDGANRSSDGTVINYDFTADPVVAQQDTDLLIIKTLSTSYTMGVATVIDNAQGTVQTSVPYGSVVMVPEPGTLAVMTLSLGLLARRRRVGH